MEKRSIAVALGLWFTVVAAGIAAESPQMGTWKLDEAKSNIPAGVNKNTTVVYSSAAGDKVKVTVEGVDKDGKSFNTTWVGKFDGKPYAAKGSAIWDQIAYTVANERTNEMKATKDGKVVATGKIEVAKDGKSRVVTIDGTDAEGKKTKTKAAYNKQ